jgi:hypothetical protein
VLFWLCKQKGKFVGDFIMERGKFVGDFIYIMGTYAVIWKGFTQIMLPILKSPTNLPLP